VTGYKEYLRPEETAEDKLPVSLTPQGKGVAPLHGLMLRGGKRLLEDTRSFENNTNCFYTKCSAEGPLKTFS